MVGVDTAMIVVRRSITVARCHTLPATRVYWINQAQGSTRTLLACQHQRCFKRRSEFQMPCTQIQTLHLAILPSRLLIRERHLGIYYPLCLYRSIAVFLWEDAGGFAELEVLRLDGVR